MHSFYSVHKNKFSLGKKLYVLVNAVKKQL